MKLKFVSRALIALLGVALATSLNAQITGVSGSTAAPPAIFGGYTMTPFAADPTAVFTTETSLPSPLGGLLSFSEALSHRLIGSGWATWSHGYTGDVYDTSIPTLTLTLPSFTTAFYFYAEPDQFSLFNITATSGATVLSETVDGTSGAKFFGFYTDGSSFLSTISLTTTDSNFALGEFAIAQGAPAAVPEPSTYALFGAASLVGMVLFRRSRQKK